MVPGHYHFCSLFLFCCRLWKFCIQQDEAKCKRIEFLGGCKNFDGDAMAIISDILDAAGFSGRCAFFPLDVPANTLDSNCKNRWAWYTL